MLRTIQHRLYQSLVSYLVQPAGAHALAVGDPALDDARATLRPGDLLLVLGRTRLSSLVARLTHSDWSHVAIYVGPHDRDDCIVEADIETGVRRTGFDGLAARRVCVLRHRGMTDAQRTELVALLDAMIGRPYALDHAVAMCCVLAAGPRLGRLLHERLLREPVPAQFICSSLAAYAFARAGVALDLPEPARQRLRPAATPAARSADDATAPVHDALPHHIAVPGDFAHVPGFDAVFDSAAIAATAVAKAAASSAATVAVTAAASVATPVASAAPVAAPVTAHNDAMNEPDTPTAADARSAAAATAPAPAARAAGTSATDAPAPGLRRGADGRVRCAWAGDDALYLAYHDDEWGRPLRTDAEWFEKISLEGFQSGLAWITILRKRENFRRAFAGFEPARVARFDDADRARLLADAGIVRHRGKIDAVIGNASRALALIDEAGSLRNHVERFRPPPHERPQRIDADSLGELARRPPPAAHRLAVDLKRRGWRFVGPTTLYALMQSTGLVDDHVEGCWCRGRIAAEAARATPAASAARRG